MAAPLRRTLHLRADPPLPSCKISAENCCRLFPTKYAASLKRFMIYGGVYALAGSVYFRDAAVCFNSEKWLEAHRCSKPNSENLNIHPPAERSRYQLLRLQQRPLLHPASHQQDLDGDHHLDF